MMIKVERSTLSLNSDLIAGYKLKNDINIQPVNAKEYYTQVKKGEQIIKPQRAPQTSMCTSYLEYGARALLSWAVGTCH